MPALAYWLDAACGVGPGGDEGWASWLLRRDVAAALFVAGVLYIAGLARARHSHGSTSVPPRQIAAFFATLVALGVALLSGLDDFAETLFSAHMAQHLLIVFVAAPLLAISNAQVVYRQLVADLSKKATPRERLEGSAHSAESDARAWGLCAAFILTLWFWHMPAVYDWALPHHGVHRLEQAMLLVVGVLFWNISLNFREGRTSPIVAFATVWLVGLQGALLGALIMFAPRALYSSYASDPLNDQVMAGILMCIPASLVCVASAVLGLLRLLGPADGSARRVQPFR